MYSEYLLNHFTSSYLQEFAVLHGVQELLPEVLRHPSQIHNLLGQPGRPVLLEGLLLRVLR